jgi:hypothetical protein
MFSGRRNEPRPFFRPLADPPTFIGVKKGVSRFFHEQFHYALWASVEFNLVFSYPFPRVYIMRHAFVL